MANNKTKYKFYLPTNKFYIGVGGKPRKVKRVCIDGQTVWENPDEVKVENEIINKYLKGEISFKDLGNELCVEFEKYINNKVKEEIENDFNSQTRAGSKNCR